MMDDPGMRFSYSGFSQNGKIVQTEDGVTSLQMKIRCAVSVYIEGVKMRVTCRCSKAAAKEKKTCSHSQSRKKRQRRAIAALQEVSQVPDAL